MMIIKRYVFRLLRLPLPRDKAIDDSEKRSFILTETSYRCSWHSIINSGIKIDEFYGVRLNSAHS